MSYERWDRDRFERAGGGRETIERDRYDERDYYDRGREEVDIRESDYRRTYAPSRERSRPPPVRESERIFFEERDRPTSGAIAPYRRPREDVRYYDERESVYEREGDMVPYRARDDEREIDFKYRRESRPFTRPQFVRRQSSLDTHDRRPLPRYGDRVHEEIVIPVPPRRRSSPRFVERDFYEDIRVAEPDYYHDEEYHPYREREREIYRRRYPPPPPSTQGEEIVYEEEKVVKSEYPKKGKTRMPKRIVNIRALIELGYEYEEEEKTIVVLKALGKDNIDEVIRISKEYNTTVIPPPPMDQPVPPPGDVEVTTRRTEIVRENPSLASRSTRSSSSSSSSSSTTVVSEKTRKSGKTHRSSKSRHHHSHSRHEHSRHSRSHHRSASTRRHRSASFSSSYTGRELVIRPPRDEQPISTALIFPREEGRSIVSIQEQLKALELERKALKLERERQEKDRHNNYLIEKEYRDGAVEIKKDRKGKMSLILNH